MKQIKRSLGLRTIFTFLTIAFLQTITWAQDNGSETGSGSASGSSTTSTTSSNVTTETSNWFASPWVWVAAAVVLILLLAALLPKRRNAGATSTRTDRVTVTKSSSVE